MRGWIYDPNVRLIDLGWRERDGMLVEGELCIRIHVVDKLPEGPMLEAAMTEGVTRGAIPEAIGGFPVDVPQGNYKLHGWWQPPIEPRASRFMPMQGGISVANGRIRGYGTLGGLVIDRETGAKMLLSNWHVLVGVWEITAWMANLPAGTGRRRHRSQIGSYPFTGCHGVHLGCGRCRTHRCSRSGSTISSTLSNKRGRVVSAGNVAVVRVGPWQPSPPVVVSRSYRRHRQNDLQWRHPSHSQCDDD